MPRPLVILNSQVTIASITNVVVIVPSGSLVTVAGSLNAVTVTPGGNSVTIDS